MYPFEAGPGFVCRQWHIAAFRDELTRTPMERTLLGKRVVLYRTMDGEPIALPGLCPHRFYPFALGRLVADDIECGYHGYRFNPAGRCVAIPGVARPPAAYQVKPYPLIERGAYVWIWMAASEPAFDQMPAIEEAGCAVSGWREARHNVTAMKARAQLLVENLLDLSHVSFLHAPSLGLVYGDQANQPPRVEDRNDRLYVRLWLKDLPTGNSVLSRALPEAPQRVNVEMTTEYYSSAFINVRVTYFAQDGRQLGAINNIHGITPETPTSTHYFASSTRDFAQNDEGFTQFLAQTDQAVRQEDIVGLEALESGLATLTDFREMTRLHDLPIKWARRKLQDKMLAETTDAYGERREAAR